MCNHHGFLPKTAEFLAPPIINPSMKGFNNALFSLFFLFHYISNRLCFPCMLNTFELSYL